MMMNTNAMLSLLFLLVIVHFGSCIWDTEELNMEMDSEINKRMLSMTLKKRYISYEALKSNVVPCTRPGAPYYNCHGVSRANPYTRGCGIITRCSRDVNP
ncbi:putative rapid ALkalinization Factor [Dioscorea sansibarensis]